MILNFRVLFGWIIVVYMNDDIDRYIVVNRIGCVLNCLVSLF